MRSPDWPLWSLLGASVLWGLSWWPLKTLHQAGFSALSLMLIAYGSLTLLHLPLFWQQRPLWRRELRPLLLIALLGGGANLAFSIALIYGEVVRVMVLFYLLPLWGVLGGKFILHEPIDRWRWLGAGTAIAGAFLVVGGLTIVTHPPSWPDAVALLSGLLFAANNLLFRAVESLPLTSKLMALLGGCLLLVGGLLMVDQLILDQGLWSIVVEPSAWLSLAGYALVWLLLANWGSQWGVTRMEASRSAIIMVTELLVAVLSAMVINQQRLTPIEGVGAVLILTAAVIEALRSNR